MLLFSGGSHGTDCTQDRELKGPHAPQRVLSEGNSLKFLPLPSFAFWGFFFGMRTAFEGCRLPTSCKSTQRTRSSS